MRHEEVMQVFRDCGALLEGHFELRSGLHSDRYFQCAKVLCFPRIAAQLCEAMVEKTRLASGGLPSADVVIAPAMGGILIGHEVARVLGVRSIFAEKQDGKLVLRRFGIRPGERVIVAEDVITRGGRVQETIDIVRACGGEVVAILVLVDRSGGKAEFALPTHSLVKMEPVTYSPDACPLCRQGIPMVHPGS